MSKKHPLASAAKLRPEGPALDRRHLPRESAESRERLTVQLPAGTIDRLRNAVYWTPGLTLTAFIERCIREHVDAMERERGSEFPARTAALRPGRPAK